MKTILNLCLFLCFSLSSFAQSVDTSTTEKKARYKISRIRDNTIRAITPADFRGAFSSIADFAALRVPFITIAELRAGKADTARVVQVNEGDKSGAFLYDPSDVTTPDDGAIAIVSGSKRYKRQYSGAIDVRWFGITADFNTETKTGTNNYYAFDTYIRAKGFREIFFPKGNYMFAVFPGCTNTTIKGEEGTNIYLKQVSGSTAAMVQFKDNQVVENIRFESVEPDFPVSRSNIENAKNVTITNCGFINFRNPTGINAWGTYIKNSENITLDRCYYGGNSQSDIVILEGAKNITILNPRNIIDTTGVGFNLEPNTSGASGLSVVGGVFRFVNILENSATTYGSRYLSFSSAIIKKLIYDGAGVRFVNCKISELWPEATLSGQFNYAGDLDIPLDLSPNLLRDPYLIDLQQSGSNTEWNLQYATSYNVSRLRTTDGVYTRINPTATAQQHTLQTRNYIPVTSGKKLLVYYHGRAVIPAGASYIARNLQVRFYNASDSLLLAQHILVNRGAAGTTTQFADHFAVCVPPANTTKIKLLVGNSDYSTVSSDIKGLGVFEINGLNGSVSTKSVASSILNPARYIVNMLPDNSTFPAYFLGDEVVLRGATSGANRYVCITEGTPSTFSALNIIGAATAVASANTAPTQTAGYVQADVQAILTELRDLKTKLRSAKLLAP